MNLKEIDVSKLKTVLVDFKKLSDVVDIYVKKIVFGELVTKENGIDCKIPIVTGLVNKLQYDTDKQILEKMIEDVD